MFIRPPGFFSGETGDKVSNHELGMSITFVGIFNRVFGLSILTAGRGREERPDVRRSETGDSCHKIVLDQGVLQGLIFVGEVRNEGLYTGLIRMKADVSSYADSLLRGSYGYGLHLVRSMKTV